MVVEGLVWPFLIAFGRTLLPSVVLEETLIGSGAAGGVFQRRNFLDGSIASLIQLRTCRRAAITDAMCQEAEAGASPQHLPCAELISPRTARCRIPPISTPIRALETAAIA